MLPRGPAGWTLLRAVLLLAVATGLGACAGTPPPDPPSRAELARAALAEGDVETAGLQAKLALQADPLDAEAHFVLACVLSEQGEVDQALVGFRRAWTVDPGDARAAFNEGTLLLRRDEAVHAVGWLEAAVAARPDYVPAYNNLAKAYYLAGLPELAAASYEQALHLDPGNALALGNLATLCEAAGLPDAAADYRRRRDGAESARGRAPRNTAASATLASATGRAPASVTIAADEAAPTAASTLADMAVTPAAALADAPLDLAAAPAAAAPPAAAPAALADDPPPSAADLDRLAELLSDLPFVRVELRAGVPTVAGWTRDTVERALLERVLQNLPGVLDLTTIDAGDSQRMIEMDATIFVVTAVGSESKGFNFLRQVNFTYDYFAASNRNAGIGFAGPDTLGAVAGGNQSGWVYGASVDYDVNIANALDERVAVLARPHLTTLSGTPATFIAGGEFVFLVTGNIGGNIEPYPFGTTLNVTPTLLRSLDDDGTPLVHVRVEAGRTSPLELLVQEESSASDSVVFDKVNVTGEAVLAPGRTLILSGLDQKERRAGHSGVPLLRDVPLLKYFFSTTTVLEVDTSVIILLTPRDPAFVDAANRAELSAFVEKRRAFVAARRGSEADWQRFTERYPDWQDIPPNRFASHFFLLANSELYRAFSGTRLTEEDLALDILGNEMSP